MKRLVYAPEVNVWIKSDTGIFDLSPYVLSFNVNRKVDAISSAEVTFRNPKVEQDDGRSNYLFTEHLTTESDGSKSYRPMFHPMDPIVITLTRLKGHPVQVFTGYCDTAPYVQLFPGQASIQASCTLKRLKYTYWDPGLPFVTKYLASLGWIPTAEGLTVNAGAETANTESGLSDSSIGYLLYNILQDVGGWVHDDIYIQELPSEQIVTAVSQIYESLTGDAKASYKTFIDFLSQVIGQGSIGGAGGSNSGGGRPASVGYPLAVRGEFIGGSNKSGSTHDPNSPPNNWQSDNAVDIGVPVGTSVFAVADGTITNVRGSYKDGSGRMEGLRFTLVTKDNKWFYQHNSQRFVQEGQKVKKGDLLAKTGSGNGVPHLHIGCEKGKPEDLLGLKV